MSLENFKVIYVVFGRTGAYADYQEWPVKAFYEEEKAKQLVESATAKAIELWKKAKKSHSQYSFYHQIIDEKLNEFDPNMEMDYNGTNYDYKEVEVE